MSRARNVREQHVTGEAQPQPPHVFISYSHDSPEHKARVRALAERLLSDGVEVTLDQYVKRDSPAEGWPRWMDRQIMDADCVLLICTETYRRRVEAREEPGVGHGALWEGNLVYQHIYNAATRNERFIPVLLDGAKFEDIPTPLQGVNHYRPETDDGYQALYRRITDQPRIVKPSRGTLKSLPPATQPPLRTSAAVAAFESTTWLSVGGYIAAVVTALFAYRVLEEPLKGTAWWVRPLLAVVPLAVVLFGHTIPSLIDHRRRRRLKEVSGELKPGYFRLSPREDEDGFTRADNKHEEVLRWLNERRAPVLYLTGQSGSGKSSILSAWVVPRITQQEPPVKVIQLRGYQDPLSVFAAKLREPGVIWTRPPETNDIRQLLERACRHIRPARLLIVFDQFEEFVILHGETERQAFEHVFASLVENPIDGLTFLLVLRSDYVEVLERLALPKLAQDTNWKAVPPFTEQAARGFLRGSGLTIDDAVEHAVLREAAEIEEAKGLIRPVTLNLCGLVLGRFATGLPRGFRPGGMIRGFVRESVDLPGIREVTPHVIPALITYYVTKRPRTVTELSQETTLEEPTIRGCLRVLAQPDRGIVRPLDPEQEQWEISHDFLVPLLDAIFARWSVSVWRRTRPFLPWIAAASMALIAIVVSFRPKDPIGELTELGWVVIPGQEGGIRFTSYERDPRWTNSGRAFLRVRQRFGISLHEAETLVGMEVLQGTPFLSHLLIGGPFSDLNPLRHLNSVARIDIDNGYNIRDLTPLRGLKHLSRLSLTGNRIVSDLNGLENLESLEFLFLSGTQVRDISPLRALPKLLRLFLENTQVADLTPLRNLKSLHWVGLGNTPITDISPLHDLQNLEVLDISNTRVTDLSPLRELKRLKKLSLKGTEVTDHQMVDMLEQRGVEIQKF